MQSFFHRVYISVFVNLSLSVCVCTCVYLGLLVPLAECGREPMLVGLGICREDQLSDAVTPVDELSM